MKKALILLILAVFNISVVLSQHNKSLNLARYDAVPIHFGMSLAVNTMDFTINKSGLFLTNTIDSIFAIESGRTVGFNINMVSNYNIARFFSIRFLPGLSFGQRDLEYQVYDKSTNLLTKHIMKLESTYLDFPVLIQYKSARLNNFRMYWIAGGCYKYDLAAQKKINPDELPKIRLKSNSYYYTLGSGADFFQEGFKFAVELKYDIGINSVMVKDNTQYTKAIEKMSSRIITLSFLFEGSDIRNIFGRDARSFSSRRVRKAF